MAKQLFKIILYTSLMVTFSYGKEYSIHLKSGWQLLGLPSNIDSMRVFNNENVRLVWFYDGKYGDWLGYSPEKEIIDKLYENGITILTSIKRWHGVWVYSYNEWDLTVEEDTELYLGGPEIGKINLYKGWNLLSLPFQTVLSSEIFSDYKVWRYSDEKEWQTNQRYKAPFDYPEIDEINTKSGFWIYSGVDRELDIPKLSADIESLTTNEELYEKIEKTLVVGERKDKFWGWREQEEIYSLVDSKTVTISEERDAISNSNEPKIDETTVRVPKVTYSDDNYIYYLNSDKNGIKIQVLDTLLSSGVIEPLTISVTFKNPDTDQSYNSEIRNFYVVNSGERLVVVSKLLTEKQSPTFTDSCRENKSVISIYDISNIAPNTTLARKHIYFDGDINSSRMVGNSLYFFSKFEPCIELEYPQNYLDYLDECKYPEETTEYYNRCYDVVEDDDGELFRYDYESPSVKNIYYMPKYLDAVSSEWSELITPETLYTLPKLDQKASIFSMSNIDIVSGEVSKTVSIFGELEHVSLSSNSIYLTYPLSPYQLSFEDYQAREKIYKFNFYPEILYKASGWIDGEIINRFGLSEFDKTLRVGTRDSVSWDEEVLGNRVENFVEQNGELQRVGRVLDFVNEIDRVKSIKFFRDIAIASVYRETAPFYTLDLTDNEAPKRGGEIDIDGDTQLIKVSHEDNRLIAVGREVTDTGNTGGVKIDIFDISDIERPELFAQKVIGDYYNFSPSLSNPLALNYRSSDKKLSIPVGGGESGESADSGLYNFYTANGILENSFVSIPTIQDSSEGEITLIDMNNLSYSIFTARGKINRVVWDK
jgi:hypothetical protein